ncbi:pentatricopeptide repeat-containing protein At1g31790 [Coffea eugenioides]|uniref:pentatricopeptide repeat-containing protein At1g31790 n=1 Tax=Coffea eugenioides TaxID=49369 RepID=UPI000F614F29|nr:pentatricopeptide repeat-containing protein At1g31790 [Coffea eugenioides]
MTVRSSCTWAVMVAGYFENGDYGEVIDLFLEMQCSERAKVDGDMDDIVASAIVVCVLKACAKTVNMELGKQVHAWVVKMGYGENLVFSGSLMRFYGKAGFLEGSDCVFYQVPNRNKVIWTTKIVNHCYEEQFDEAFDVFKQMGREGVKKNSYTFSSVLKACASMRDGGCCGQQVHANVVKLGLELNEHVQCGLVNMYGKGGLIKDAQKVFKICGNNRSGACWNAMLTGYIQQGLGIEAFRIICDMKAAGLQPQESLLNEGLEASMSARKMVWAATLGEPSCRSISGPWPPGNPSTPLVSNLLAVQQAAARNTAIPEQNSTETKTSNLVGLQTTAHATLRAEISSSNLPVPTPPSQTSAMLVIAHSSVISRTGTNAAYSPSSRKLAMTDSSETLSGPYHPSVLSTSHWRPLYPKHLFVRKLQCGTWSKGTCCTSTTQ